MVISDASLPLTASVSDDFPNPGPAIRNTAWLARLRMVPQTCSITSFRPVSCLWSAAGSGFCGRPLDESRQITPGSHAQLGEDLVKMPFHGPDGDAHLQGNVAV